MGGPYPASPHRLRDGIVRDEQTQTAEIGALLDLVESSGVAGAFV